MIKVDSVLNFVLDASIEFAQSNRFVKIALSVRVRKLTAGMTIDSLNLCAAGVTFWFASIAFYSALVFYGVIFAQSLLFSRCVEVFNFKLHHHL